MMHLLGAGLLVLAGGLFAQSKASEVKAHLAMLSSFEAVLSRMSGEIQSNLTPVGEFIELTAETETSSARQFFVTVHESLRTRGAPYLTQCWTEAVTCACAVLSHREQDALRSLGSILGRCDVSEECAAIDRCITELNRSRDALQSRFAADAKLYAGLGLAAGCILAIVLL